MPPTTRDSLADALDHVEATAPALYPALDLAVTDWGRMRADVRACRTILAARG